ncbi:lipase [Mangrovactinospora gilvigrisea]|uniref:Lipase n=2 Tax=Mangrovactinospora gilvigrisea TaxID=1428644 RepID=A0A1J7C8N3_9ACTN|nr:lipase [Mangrovactinospora gilvigrisea]
MITTTIDDGLVRGALELEPTARGLVPHRLPAAARRRIPDGQLAMAEAQPSGVRLVLRTAATVLELDVVATKRHYPGAPPRPDGVYDLLVDGELAAQASVDDGDVLTLDMATGSTRLTEGPARTVRFDGLPARDKRVEVWLPHDEATRLVALRTDAPVRPVAEDDGRRVWLHHGSSISHGSNAAHPTGTWPAVAAARAGVELVNLGFGGSALLDPFVARAIRDTPADLISIKLGINLVNSDGMRLRIFTPAVHGFLDTVRDGHPTTPLVVVSAIHCAIHEAVPGPAAFDTAALAEGRVAFTATGDPEEVAAGKLTLAVIRAELARIVKERAADDPNLGYVDGLDLYGEADAAELPLPDNLHPDPAAHRRIGERFASLALSGTGS